MIDKSKYVVLDVETNGLSSIRDDLLSISIYKPDTKDMYNRFLPLDKNDYLYKIDVNGITKSMLKHKHHLTQEEVDKLIYDFELDKRIILTYGSLDEKFIYKYMQRHNLEGFEKLNFFNFKHNIISTKFSEGNISKDNMCRIFKIPGVKDVHSGVNDCLLEWKLFEKLDNNKLLIIGNRVYVLNSDYIIPASYLDSFPNFKYHTTLLTNFDCEFNEIYRYKMYSKNFKKFDTNITGITIEHLLNTLLNAEQIDSTKFLVENKRKMLYIGKLYSLYNPLYIELENDGTISEVYKEDKEEVDEINRVTNEIKPLFLPVINYIKDSIFKNDKIKSQELMFSPDKKVLALCDLSNQNAVLEIKTGYNKDLSKYSKQLYVESNNRDCYILTLDWKKSKNTIDVIISKVTFKEKEKMNSLNYRLNQFTNKMLDKTIEVLYYHNTKSKIKLRCKKCGHVWESTYIGALKNNICPICNNKESNKLKNKKESKKIQKTPRSQIFIDKVYKKSKGIIICDEYKSSKEPAKFHCVKCNKKWETRPDHINRIIEKHVCCNQK